MPLASYKFRQCSKYILGDEILYQTLYSMHWELGYLSPSKDVVLLSPSKDVVLPISGQAVFIVKEVYYVDKLELW